MLVWLIVCLLVCLFVCLFAVSAVAAAVVVVVVFLWLWLLLVVVVVGGGGGGGGGAAAAAAVVVDVVAGGGGGGGGAAAAGVVVVVVVVLVVVVCCLFITFLLSAIILIITSFIVPPRVGLIFLLIWSSLLPLSPHLESACLFLSVSVGTIIDASQCWHPGRRHHSVPLSPRLANPTVESRSMQQVAPHPVWQHLQTWMAPPGGTVYLLEKTDPDVR